MRAIGRETAGEPIHVETRAGLPHRLIWRGRPWSVTAVEAIWCVEGRWWTTRDRVGARRRTFRLNVRAPGGASLCVEVYRQGASWRLWRVAD